MYIKYIIINVIYYGSNYIRKRKENKSDQRIKNEKRIKESRNTIE